MIKYQISDNRVSPSVEGWRGSARTERIFYKLSVAEGCRRLIKNAIICWNYLYLARSLADEKDEERRAALIEVIRNGSVTTWKHFNLHGEFDFSDERMIDSMGLTPPRNISIKRG